MAASWVLATFQGAQGWERFDVPWFIALEKRPESMTLSSEGLKIQFSRNETGYIYSMPLYGYEKLPQGSNDFAAKYNLPSSGWKPAEWSGQLPNGVVERCNWWARVSKSYPIGVQESFSVDPHADEITFRQDYKWLVLNDDWSTRPLRFTPLPPSVALAWKFPGFPMEIASPVHDPDYFTAFGPVAGAVDTDRLEFTLHVLQYLHEVEWPLLPDTPNAVQQQAISLIVGGLKSKFRDPWRFTYDHGGRENFCWNIVGDVWYPRAIPFAPQDVSATARSSLRVYMRNDVLRPHSPYHGRYLLHGPGVGSWGESGDAGKFMTDALQAIWAYAQFAGDWELIRERWALIKRFFVTPDEADWVSFGRYAIAEIGDEAAPCSAFARMAWAVGDADSYLLGAYMFSRELVHLYVKQRAAKYFYDHQPYNQYAPMPPRIYPTDLWGSTRGWQLDGPTWAHLPSGEHQSANRWVRFHDPDVGRFYRDNLEADVASELDWYEDAGQRGLSRVYELKRYQDWSTRDNPHIMPSLLRLRSFLTDYRPRGAELVQASSTLSGWGAADIAKGYAMLRQAAPVKYVRTVPKSLSASPFVLGLDRRGKAGQVLNTVQDIADHGLSIEPRWQGWGRQGYSPDGYLSFGRIEGDFPSKVAGEQGTQWLSPACQVSWSDGTLTRDSVQVRTLLAAQDLTPVAVIGPFANLHDEEILDTSYPPETDERAGLTFTGLHGPVTWRVTRLASGRHLDLKPELSDPNGQGTLAYVAQFIWSPEEKDAYLFTRHQGGIVGWINDQEIIRYHGFHRSTEDDAMKGLCRLRRGWNRVLLKVESFTGDYTFQFRLVGLDRLPLPSLKFSARPSEG